MTPCGSVVRCGDGYRNSLHTPKIKPHQAVSQILFQFDNLNDEPSSSALKDCDEILIQFKEDPEFIRIFQPRLVKLIDKLIVTSLVNFVNSEARSKCFTDFCTNSTGRQLQPTIVSFLNHSEDIECLEISCQIIQHLCDMVPGGLKISSNIFEIILENLLNCLIITSKRADTDEGPLTINYTEPLASTMLRILEVVEIDETVINWFEEYLQTFKNDKVISELMKYLFPYFSSRLEFYKGSHSLRYMAGNCENEFSSQIENQNSTYDYLKQNRIEFSNLDYVEEAWTVTNYQESPKVPMSGLYSRETVHVPEWLAIFQQLSIKTKISKDSVITPRIQIELPPKRNHAHLHKLKTKWYNFRQSMLNKEKNWIDMEEPGERHFLNYFKNWKRPVKSNNGREKLQEKKRKKSRQRRKQKRQNIKRYKRRLNQRRVHHPVKSARAGVQYQKLLFYYKLNHRSYEVARLKHHSIENTYLGVVRGRAHKIQIRCKSKMDRISEFLYGYDL